MPSGIHGFGKHGESSGVKASDVGRMLAMNNQNEREQAGVREAQPIDNGPGAAPDTVSQQIPVPGVKGPVGGSTPRPLQEHSETATQQAIGDMLINIGNGASRPANTIRSNKTPSRLAALGMSEVEIEILRRQGIV